MSIKRTYVRAAAPAVKHLVEFTSKFKLLSSIPEIMRRGVLADVDSSLLTIADNYVIPDNVDVLAVIIMPVVEVPYMLFIDLNDNSLRLIPAVYNDSVLATYNVSTKGGVIGYLPTEPLSISKDLQAVIEEDDSVNYSIATTDVLSVTAEVITTNDPELIHNRTVIRGLNNQDRTHLSSVAHFDVLAVTITTTPSFNIPLWFFENLGSAGMNLRYAGFNSTTAFIFTIGI